MTPYETAVAAIQRGEVRPAYLLAGPSRVAARAVIRALVAACVEEARRALDAPLLEGASLSWDELVALLETPPLMGGRRVVTVEDPAGLAPRRGTARPGGAGEGPFLDWLARPTPGVTVVLWSRDPVAAGHPVAQAVASQGGFVDCRQPSERLGRAGEGEAADWCVRWAAQEGLRLPRALAARLVAAVGADLDRLEVELQKMALFAEGGAIGADAFAVASADDEERVFALVDALAARDAARTGRELERLLGRGESPLGVLALLANEVRIMRLAKELGARGVGPEEAARRIGANAYRVRRALQAARRFREDELADAVEAVWRAEWRIKAGEWEEASALAWAVARILGGPGAALGG